MTGDIGSEITAPGAVADPKRSTDWSAFRAKFPAISNFTYLDTATHGPISADALMAAHRYYQWSNSSGEVASGKWLKEVDACRNAVAKLLGAGPEEIGFVHNTSMAMVCAALLFEGQGAVLTARNEHPTVVTPWYARKYKVYAAEPDENGLFTVGAFERALRPDIKIISISHLRYNDGQVMDLAGLGHLARERNLHLVVDATQSAGILPIDVNWGIDVLAFAGFKWLNAGHGAGAIYVRDGLLEQYGLPIAGRQSRSTDQLVEITELAPLYEARAFELGALSVPAIMALGASLNLLRSIGADQVLGAVAENAAKLRDGLHSLGLRPQALLEAAPVSPIVSLRAADSQGIVEVLARRGVIAAARAGFLRFGISWYNDQSDVENCIVALGETIIKRR
ncbi:aminotransferase class V-fold PLP-dependent enzyme [Sphingosinicella rhizophila]|uniref:Aminotransferase class V-fold PLP-dependent enzyme n=1 Tax=Sphingosinicella rhizophila TaxID=3050082 RepID=A0ABU3Q6S9_9SPHN|nr:aminotransferase class V-fold PLP-dependent enzyme [Sphingosinicella sp. GR2756]MDT9598678.1 aminotransferase class V-fold PLP-dependent enzyme [Sphingosinicella sp. GR2756]